MRRFAARESKGPRLYVNVRPSLLVFLGHNYLGHNYLGDNYLGHNYLGHTYLA